MATSRPPLNSPTYPYYRVIKGANRLRGMELIPYKLLMYLLDLPDAFGYTPIDDNEKYPRCRLNKYIWYDGPNPLDNPLPTPQEKLSLLFDPEQPDINTDTQKAAHPQGYRYFWQRLIGQSQLEAGVILKCYLGRISEPRKFETNIGVIFEVWVNVNLETNTKTSAYQRSVDIEQCLHEALDGVNIAGVGTVSFARNDSIYNGSEPIWDEMTNIGRYINCSVAWAEGGGNAVQAEDCL